MTDSENLHDCWLEPTVLATMLATQAECTFMWTNSAGQPFGVIMSFIYEDGSFWVTSAEARVRVAAIRRTGYASICISSKGTDIGTGKTASYRGPCVVHDDRATLDWMLPRLARKIRPDDPSGEKAFLDFIDTPNRVVLQLTPDFGLDFDSAKMWQCRPDAAPPGRRLISEG